MVISCISNTEARCQQMNKYWRLVMLIGVKALLTIFINVV